MLKTKLLLYLLKNQKLLKSYKEIFLIKLTYQHDYYFYIFMLLITVKTKIKCFHFDRYVFIEEKQFICVYPSLILYFLLMCTLPLKSKTFITTNK